MNAVRAKNAAISIYYHAKRALNSAIIVDNVQATNGAEKDKTSDDSRAGLKKIME